jgi:hypothetical protein
MQQAPGAGKMLRDVPVSQKLLKSIQRRQTSAIPSPPISPELLGESFKRLRKTPQRAFKEEQALSPIQMLARQVAEKSRQRQSRIPDPYDFRERYLMQNWMKQHKGELKGMNWDAASLLAREAGAYSRPKDVEALRSEASKKSQRRDTFSKFTGAIPRLYAGWRKFGRGRRRRR